MNYLIADLYNDFNCIADACPNTCCAGWIIKLDEPTYQNMSDNEDKLGMSVENWVDKNDNGYIVKLNDDGHCPMLNDCNLCKIVLSLGPSYLSPTCTEYPRVRRQFGNVIEGYLSPSCPDVIAKLMSKEKVYFDYAEDDKPAAPYPHTKLYLYESAVRTEIINLLYDFQDFALNTRLFVSFNIVNEAVNNCINDTPDFNTVKKMTDSYYSNGVISVLDNRLRNIVSEHSRFEFLQKMISIFPNIISSITASDYIGLMKQATDYFIKTDFETYYKDITAFKEAIKPYHGFHTNYCAYRCFYELMGIPDYSNIKDNFIYICVEFCLMQIIALASYAENQTLDKDKYIYIISSISRMEHSSHKELIKNLHNNNLISNAGLLLMII